MTGIRKHADALIVAILAVLLVSGSYWLSARALNRATHTAVNTTQLCEAGNMARAQQAALWDYVISLSKPPPTVHGRAVLTRFEQHLHVVFAPRNCSAPLTRQR